MVSFGFMMVALGFMMKAVECCHRANDLSSYTKCFWPLHSLGIRTAGFCKSNAERLWNTESKDLLELDKDHFPVRCATAVSDTCVWFGCGDNIYVVDVSVLRLDVS